MEKDHYTYVIELACLRCKIGVTKQPLVRLATYVRESTRHGGEVHGFWVSTPMTKALALHLETSVKQKRAINAVAGHAETFEYVSPSSLRVEILALGMSFHQRFIEACGRYAARTATQRAAVLLEVLKKFDADGQRIVSHA